MKSIRQYLNEHFVNASIDDEETKKKYRDQVWDILQSSYKDIGGIKGSGFANPDDMVDKIPFWKMVVKDGKVKAVNMYKDKGGRKSVAIGGDGSEYALKHIKSMFANDLKRSYGEKSKSALGLLLKTVPWSVLEAFTLDPSTISGVTPIAGMDIKDLPDDAKKTIERFPHLRRYGYLRDFGDIKLFKVAFGIKGQDIK